MLCFPRKSPKDENLSRTIWFTGSPGAGKSTLTRSLEQAPIGHHACAVLDGDELRRGLCRKLGYSPAYRSENIRRAAEIMRLLTPAGTVANLALTSPLATRRPVRNLRSARDEESIRAGTQGSNSRLHGHRCDPPSAEAFRFAAGYVGAIASGLAWTNHAAAISLRS